MSLNKQVYNGLNLKISKAPEIFPNDIIIEAKEGDKYRIKRSINTVE